MVRTRGAFLPIGYGIVIALLVLASIEAYSIQRGISERHFDTYRKHVKQDVLISELRRTVWIASGQVRDFFLDVRPDCAAILDQQLKQLRGECDAALAGLERLDRRWGAHAGLRTALDSFWKAVEPVPETMAASGRKAQYDFVQREVIP